jgi:acyl-CoA synthetase (AMP-forming)/AMP-acid ligase II
MTMLGQMMGFSLTITSIMKFAQRVHGSAEIVSVTGETPRHRTTMGESLQRSHKVANALHKLGVEQGDRVGTLAWNDYRHLELYFAIPSYGAVCHTINPRLFPEQVAYIINHAKDRVLFVDPNFVPLLEMLASQLSAVQHIVVLCHPENMPETTLNNVHCYELLISAESAEFEWPELDEKTAASLCYTSGTTGDPKGVLYNHRSIVLHSMMTGTADVMGIGSSMVLMAIVPMFHVNAWGSPFTAAMTGAKLVLPGAKMADGETLCDLINTEQVSFSLGVPTIWLALVRYLDATSTKIPSLTNVVVGGAATPLSLMKSMDRYGVYMNVGWGMTETGPLGVYNKLLPWMDELPESERDIYRLKAGRAIYGVEMKLLDDSGDEIEWDGENSGSLWVRGPWVASSYFNTDKGAENFVDGWFNTGDVGNIDRYGYLQITDRSKDVIKSGGEWISSIDVENAAMSHSDVAEAAVIGVPHPRWTERPLLIVVPVEGVEPDAKSILASLEGKIAKWWIPDECQFVIELPHTATGKVSKKDIRGLFKDYSYD